MNRREYLLLNIASLVLAVLLLGHFFFSRYNAQISDALAQEQAYINKANNLSPVLNQLSMRIAKGSDADPNLKNVLRRYGLNVTLDVDGKKIMYP